MTVGSCRGALTRRGQFLNRVMTDRPRTSAIRVLGKSMYVLSAGWLVSVAWLWIAGLQQHVLRHYEAPPNYAMSMMMTGGVVPALLLALSGWIVDRWAGPAPSRSLTVREWVHGFWWSFVPNAMLLITVRVMIQESR
jgi:hypothetical protein